MILTEKQLNKHTITKLLGDKIEINFKNLKATGSPGLYLKSFKNNCIESDSLKKDAKCNFEKRTNGLLLRTNFSNKLKAVAIPFDSIIEINLKKGKEKISPFPLSPMWILLKLGVSILKARYFRIWYLQEYSIDKMEVTIKTTNYHIKLITNGYLFEKHSLFFNDLTSKMKNNILDPKLPITIQDMYALMDGGSVILTCTDANLHNFEIKFHQHMLITSSHENKLPGRIYLNNTLVVERSALEKSILSMLENATFSNHTSQNLKNILIEEIAYVRSEDYISNNKIISNKREMLFGYEFDWFAIDRNDNFGVFSTAGSANAPIFVIENRKEHDKIFSQIKLPNNHSENVWEDIAKMGFYVYDWKHNEGPFIKLASPTSKVSKAFKTQLLNLRSLVQLDISFEEQTSIKL